MSDTEKTRLMILIGQLTLGGGETLVKDIFQNLDRNKFEVRLCVYNYGGDSIYDEFKHYQDEIIVLEKQRIGLFRFWRRLWREISNFRPDVLTNWGTMTIYGRVAALLAGCPKMVTQVNGEIIPLPLVFLRNWLVNRETGLEKWLARLDAGRIAISNALKESDSRVMKFAPERYQIVYCGVNTDYFVPSAPDVEFKRSLGIPAEAQVVTMIARLAAIKNHKMLLRAARAICRERPDAYFLIVGPNWQSDYPECLEGHFAKNVDVLQALAQEYGIASQVIFTGPLRQVKKILSITDVFAMTSVSEGLNNSVLEALSAGKPVVATRVGGMQESLLEGVCGFYVASDDDAGMARFLRELLADEEKRRCFGVAARQRAVARFSIPAMMAGTEAVYHQAAAGTWSWRNLWKTGYAFAPGLPKE